MTMVTFLHKIFKTYFNVSSFHNNSNGKYVIIKLATILSRQTSYLKSDPRAVPIPYPFESRLLPTFIVSQGFCWLM